VNDFVGRDVCAGEVTLRVDPAERRMPAALGKSIVLNWPPLSR
jgi:hypothetical protein